MDGERRTVIEVPPELAAAIVAAQRACVAVEKNGHNKQLGKNYATGDDIAAAGKAALNAHGAAFVRLDTRLREPALADYDIGNMGYAGDISTRWIIVHESGSALAGTSEHAVIVNRQRPHDKAISASLTYGFGVDLRGALCMEREEPGNTVDAREDRGDGPRNERRRAPQRQRGPDLGPRCSGKKGGPIAAAIERRMRLIDDENLGEVWGAALTGAEVKLDVYENAWPQTAQVLTIGDGAKVSAWLKSELARLGIEETAP
jgi:hypothetical protein